MIKLDRGSATRLMPLLVFCVVRGWDLGEVLNYFNQNPDQMERLPEDLRRVLTRFFNTWDGENEPELKDIVEDLAGQVASKEETTDGELVEEIVEIIKSRYTRNRMSYRIMNDLRKVLLLPEERRKVLEQMKQECKCAICGHSFRSGEMATVQLEPDEKSRMVQIAFKCTRCQQPTYAACSGDNCEAHINVSGKLDKTLRQTCGLDHKKSKDVPEATIHAAEEGIIGAIIDENANRAWNALRTRELQEPPGNAVPRPRVFTGHVQTGRAEGRAIRPDGPLGGDE